MSRRRKSCFPAPGKVRIHSLYRRKMFRFSRRQGKLCPSAGKAVSRRRRKSHSCTVEENMLVFPAPGEAVPGAGSSGARFWKGSGARFRRECNFVGAGGSCVPALGKLFPGAGERSHSFIIKEKCVSFPGARGSCVPAPGKLFPGAGESCVLAPGKLFPGAGERLAGRRLVLI